MKSLHVSMSVPTLLALFLTLLLLAFLYSDRITEKLATQRAQMVRSFNVVMFALRDSTADAWH